MLREYRKREFGEIVADGKMRGADERLLIVMDAEHGVVLEVDAIDV